ncbi:MAG: MerR family transcriptional regulator [Defluviitaleaceae bacterium]|nr:MerR family transcriptional regulator [Defluviitaleaceae bacterium]
MYNQKAIPEGYMTVGQIAKKMGITVRTLQYYDKQSVLSPSAQSEGGRRLYTDKDMISLHQILSMKYLGFSLEDIKARLVSLDTPTDVANALTEHAAVIRQKIDILSESLQAIKLLKDEVLQMQSVDFRKYSDIIVNLKMKNDMYWVIKHFDDSTMDYFRGRFNEETAQMMMKSLNELQNEAIHLKNSGVSPESEKGHEFAKAFWDVIMKFAGDDTSILSKMLEISDKVSCVDFDDFISQALDAYFEKIGYNPFKKEEMI